MKVKVAILIVLVVSVAVKQYRTLRNGQGLTASLVSVHRQVTVTTVTDRVFAPSVSSSQHVQRPRLLLPLCL